MRNDGPGGARPWRLGPGMRKGLLVVHIASAGTWIGIDVVMGIVILTALLSDDATRALCYQALELIAGWPLVVTGLVCLASGVVLGLGSTYGLVRYWWVAIKLAINIVFVALSTSNQRCSTPPQVWPSALSSVGSPSLT